MFWDIVLPVLAAIAQGVTGFVGWRVTVDGVREERKTLYEWLFVVASIIGIVSVGIAAYRGSQISRDLADLRQGQTTTNKGIQEIKNTPPIVNVNPTISVPPPAQMTPIEHTTIAWDEINAQPQPGPFFPIVKDEKPRLNMGFANAGNFSMISSESEGAVILVPFVPNIDTVFKTHIKAILKSEKHQSGTVVAHSPNHSYFTYELPNPLSEQDANDFNTGKTMICGIAVVTWKDRSGTYRTSFESCVFQQSGGTFNWHTGPATNREDKLK